MKPPRIFVVDRNQVHRNLIKYHLNVNKFENVQVFQTGEECIYRIQKGGFAEFIVSDYEPEGFLNIRFLDMVRQISPETRLVFFAATDDPLLALKLLDEGASDFVVKTSRLDFGITELIKNLKYLTRESAVSRS